MKYLKAIIMAGGEGSRLRPLTCDCPKPMLRLLGRPMMEYAIRLLERSGIDEIGATLGYLPDAIMDYFADGADWGVKLRYYIEKTPLGTAGSVGQARDFLNERFVVLSGDGIMDLDLQSAVAFHEARGALATLVLVKSGTPQEYGMVVTDPDGRIRSFHEKPGRSDVYSDRINTGIYILEPEILKHIPESGAYDFGHDLFPALVQQGFEVYGCTLEGYWCDVGDVSAYLKVHADALQGNIHLPELMPSVDGAQLEPGCVLEAPVYIAPGAHISAGARIGAYSAIGEGCFVAPGASIKRSILFPGARVEPQAQLRGCVLGTNALVGEGAQLYEESAVGSASRVGARAILPPGVKLWPQKALPEGERPEENIVWGSRREQRFVGGALQLESPAQAARAAQSCVVELKPRELLIGRGASTVAQAMWHAASAGAMAQGVQLVDAGVCTLPQLRHAQKVFGAAAALMVEEDGLIPLDAAGVRLKERTQRSILKLFERQDFAGPFSGVTLPIESAGNTQGAYVAAVAAMFQADPLYAPHLVVHAPGSHLCALVERACMRCGLRVRWEWEAQRLCCEPGEVSACFDQSGERVVLSDGDGPLSEVERQLACAWVALMRGEKQLILPPQATRAVEVLAQKHGANAQYLPGEAAVWMSAVAQKSPLQFQLQTDGLRFLLAFLSELTQRGMNLRQWRESMPAAYQSLRTVCVPASQSGRLLHALAESEADAELGGGLRLNRSQGWAWLSPDEKGTGLEVMAEAANMETARELCDFYDREIRRLLASAGD